MSRIFGGNSSLGDTLNKQGSKQTGTRMNRSSHKTGEIIGRKAILPDGKVIVTKDPSLDGPLEFVVRLKDKRGKVTITSPIPLIGMASQYASSVGSPNDLIGFSCLVLTEGNSSNRGKIIELLDNNRDPASVSLASFVDAKGTSFAPPGA